MSPRAASPGPPSVALRVDHPKGARWAAPLRRAARRYLDKLSLRGVELSVALVTDAQIRALNRRWRKKDRATDVLSFPAGPLPPGHPGPAPLGDVILSLDTALRRRPRATGPELELYLAHGLLHLLGHDHHAPRQARRMAEAEARLLGSSGMVGRALTLRPGTKDARRPL